MTSGTRSRAVRAASPRPTRTSRDPRRFWLLGGLAVVVVIAIVVAVAASGGGSKRDSTANGGRASSHEIGLVGVDGDALPTYTNVGSDRGIGLTVPTLSGISVLDGSKLQIKPAGKPMAIIFLAHWCPHCQLELPRLVSAAKKGALDGIDVYAVATGTNATYPNYPPSAWLEREHWPFPALADSERTTAAAAFGLVSYPYMVFADAQGKVVGRVSGELSPADLVKVFSALAAGTPLPKIVGGAASGSLGVTRSARRGRRGRGGGVACESRWRVSPRRRPRRRSVRVRPTRARPRRPRTTRRSSDDGGR
jgi:thiol-disulfide isomerase/thioredoxin